MRVLVCGGRFFNDKLKLEEVLSQRLPPCVELICGMANGADTLAFSWAEERGHIIHSFPAEWGKFGKAAGPIRNRQMLDEGKPDLVIAFSGGRGTKNMISQALKRGVSVVEIS